MTAIRTEQLTRRYRRRRGIEALNLVVPEGSRFGFLGPNGAGKTTTIRVLLGFLRPTSGNARILDRDCWRQSTSIKADVGYLPGDLRLYSWMNGERALAIFGAARRLDLKREGHELAQRFGLDLSVKVRQMSRGMRQKLGLILALAHRPRLLVLDEPSSALDPLMQEALREHLQDLARQGHTIFFSSHSLDEIERLCDRVAIVRDGRLVADETLETLRRRAGHEISIRFKNAHVAQSLPPPPFLRVHRRHGSQWDAALTGPVEELIRWLAPHAIDDLTIGRPDLESLFRRYYEE
jgi:ABC-2 type transport system ATP-binding protein